MTQRLYYTDPFQRSFDATIRGVGRRDGHIVVFLDRTAFYPTSGGQPYDTGTLAGYPVVDVVDEDGGDIAHVLAPEAAGRGDRGEAGLGGRAALHEGGIVHGEIDWNRRFDHMQQHTGQHVLSAAIDRLFGVRTLSFHLGADVSTIDIAREMSAPEIAEAEEAANRVVWEDRPIAIRFVTKEEAARLSLRKEPVREGTLRLIDVEGWDLSACGGTHVASSGGIGVIAVAGWERFKGGQRLEFLCGGRALRRFRASRDVLAASTRLLSVLPADLPASIERLHADAKEQKRASAALQTELDGLRAAQLAADTETSGAGRLVLGAFDADAGRLKGLATAVTREPGFFVVLVSTATPALVVVARSTDRKLSSQQVLSALMARFGGRGGGRPELAQAGGLSGTPDEILEAARAFVRQTEGSEAPPQTIEAPPR
jgi:alanyl-tRNA synthetase